MQFAEAFRIRALGFFKIAYGAFAQEEAKHGADAGRCYRHASGLCGVLDAGNKLLGCGRQLLVGAGLLEQFQGLDAGGHRQGVPAEGSGIKTLELLKQPGTYEKLTATTQKLVACIKDGAQSAGMPITAASVSAMFGFFLCEGPVRNFEEAKATDSERFGKLHRAMLERGIYLAPSAFEAGFTSLAHSDADIEATINAFRESFAAVA